VKLKMHQNKKSAWALPQTPLGDLTALLQTLWLDYNLSALQASIISDYAFWFSIVGMHAFRVLTYGGYDIQSLVDNLLSAS